ncbi:MULTISPECIES: substrate-binding domain-containing protein [unclassified Gordonia (in: high G+C Gram-positive bacteria)]|uniref:substrate-binding domain-containing protein n=1 Tax=unclassified Gordonia (in: high G+C Gram-positive bacteria) TaxID=2657482 RepID=UPI0007EAEAF7|nr:MULTISPECIES: substrate-binding domain-containing protein [unclassified Gordonia (in: high G+C Gram-positive bacteria)]OBC02646.1 hypothetical protein A5785_02150 [Gordonia sp. 852002-50395_SCH5434458]OBC10655.1 hypothetical protein A5786_05040 [Gordonia sp. 852002-50816_SCH5313054-a]OBC17309.1 hypothetical protein A5788_12385 [Gordonia sp. 852002-50816_SCH5313054-c]
MAHHRVTGGGSGIRQRGVSRGLVFVLLALVLIAAVIVAWQQLGDHLDKQADSAAASCIEGPATVDVVADADVAPALIAIAREFGASKPVVRDHCITVAVRAGDAKTTLDGLAGNWDAASMGAFPAAWIPQSSVWAAELAQAKPSALEGTPTSLVTSPVVLATSAELGSKIDGKIDWGQVPTLQQRDGSLRDFDITGWGSLRMAMPLGAQSDASSLAAQAVAMRVMRTTGPLTNDDASSDRVASSVGAMLDGAPQSPDGSPVGAATVMRDASDAKTSPIHAVPITEQQLYKLTREDSTARLAEIVPSGPTPFADFPIIRLAGDQVSPVASAAIADFFRFAQDQKHLSLLTSQGFRGNAPLPPATKTVGFPITKEPMPQPENSAIVTINKLVYGRDFGPSA